MYFNYRSESGELHNKIQKVSGWIQKFSLFYKSDSTFVGLLNFSNLSHY